MLDLTALPEIPKQEYTYKVISVAFESAHMLVEYTPVDSGLTKVTLNLGILPGFDINDVDSYVDLFAPHDRWYAQEIIRQHGDTLLGLNK